MSAPPRIRFDSSIGPECYWLSTRVSGGESPACPRIVAGGDAGLTHARTTLAHLARESTHGHYPAITIEDGPRYPYRGLMLDIARHFHPVATILDVIDVMAELKLNMLHLHLTDDQGWRIEIPDLPELTGSAAATGVGDSPGGFLTLEDYRRIQDRATLRHITVIPEIDMPGHTHAALVAYPELGPTKTAQLPYHGVDVGFSSVDVHSEYTYEFLDKVITTLARHTDGPYLHIGGDECLEMTQEDYRVFAARVTSMVAETGKTLMAWHEMGSSTDLRPGTVGQYWNLTVPWTPEQDRFGIDHADRVASFVRQGGRVVLSPADVTYFDIKHTADDPTGEDWAGGPTTLRDAYEWDPATIFPDLNDAVLGVEATCFTEYIATREHLFTMLLPRLAAFADIAWAPAPGPYRERTLSDLMPRLIPLANGWRRRWIPMHESALVPTTTGAS